MSPAEAETAYRIAQQSLPTYRLGYDELDRALRAMPPPPDGAPVAWRHARLREIIQEIYALGPVDVAEAMAATQIVVIRHHAAHTARLSLDQALSSRLMLQVQRTVETLLRAAGQTERMLRARQQRRAVTGQVPATQAPAAVQFDLEALDAVWCRTAPRLDPPASTGVETEAAAGAAPAPVPPCDTQQVASAPAAATSAKFTLCGQRIDLVRLGSMLPAGTA